MASDTKGLLAAFSALVDRARLSSLLGKTFGGRRDLYEVLGYSRNLTEREYFNRYLRQDIANRIVDAPVSATWRKRPTVHEDSDTDNETPFEEDWNALTKRLRVWHYLERVDRLAGLGRYGVLLVGLRGEGDLRQPLRPRAGRGVESVIYLSPFGEKSAGIKTWVTDPGDPNFGRPATYRVNLSGNLSDAGFRAGTVNVHRSRVIHVAEGLLEDEVFGQPRLQKVFNRLDDLEKLAGGSAEMFWQGARKGMQADINPDVAESGNLSDEQMSALQDELDEYFHGLRRWIRTVGVDIKDLGGQTADPTGPYSVIIDLISAATRIPKRILLGSERGELSSSQDETNWNTYIDERRHNYAEPTILRPFIDLMIGIGVLRPPADGYTVEWPNLFEPTTKEKAEAAASWAKAIKDAAPAGSPELLVPPEEFRERYLELPAVPELLDGTAIQMDEEDDDEDDDDVQEQFRQGRGA